jgi:molybdopterin converting factor small subunit
MKVIFYGRFADAIAHEVDVDVPQQSTVAELRSLLDQLYPGLGLNGGHVRACVAGAIIGDDLRLSGDQPVEILAPVSGG